VGIGAVQSRLRPAHHLDPLDVLDGEIREVEIAVGEIVDLHAVDHHQHVVRFRAADAHLGEAAAIASLVDRDAGHVAQGIGDGGEALAAQLLAADHRDGGADLGRLGRPLVGGHDELRQRDALRKACRRPPSDDGCGEAECEVMVSP
jgi:hypothetical protein